MKTKSLIIILAIFLFSCGSGQQKKDKTAENQDLNSFWKNFQKTMVNEDYSALREFTYFPFLNHGFYLSEQEFSELSFPDYIIEAVGNAETPVKSSMWFNGGSDMDGNPVDVDFTGSEIFEVNLDGPAIYFTEIEGNYKFIAILYGE
jgi:hypothetical protein